MAPRKKSNRSGGRNEAKRVRQVIARSRALLDLAEVGARGADPEVAQDRLASLRRELTPAAHGTSKRPTAHPDVGQALKERDQSKWGAYMAAARFCNACESPESPAKHIAAAARWAWVALDTFGLSDRAVEAALRVAVEGKE